MLFMRVVVLRLLLLCKLLRSCWSREYQWRRTLLDSAWFYCLYYWLILCILIFSDPMVHVLQEMVVRIWILNNKFMWKKVLITLIRMKDASLDLMWASWKYLWTLWFLKVFTARKWLRVKSGVKTDDEAYRLTRYDLSGFISSHFRWSYL